MTVMTLASPRVSPLECKVGLKNKWLISVKAGRRGEPNTRIHSMARIKGLQAKNYFLELLAGEEHIKYHVYDD